MATGVVGVIDCIAHTREPLGRARGRWARRIGGQPEVRQDLLDDRTVLDGRQQAQPPGALGSEKNSGSGLGEAERAVASQLIQGEIPHRASPS